MVNSKKSINVFSFDGKLTRRVMLVYVVEIINQKKESIYYVGKVGDNRVGCNPIISRIGNHFSYNKFHSQLRNKIERPEDFTNNLYKVFTLDVFDYIDDDDRKRKVDIVNEYERSVNILLQEKVGAHNILNSYKGKHVNKIESKRRFDLLKSNEREKIIDFIKVVIN